MKKWVKVVIACFLGAGVFFGIIGYWPGIIFAVIASIAFGRAFGPKNESKKI